MLHIVSKQAGARVDFASEFRSRLKSRAKTNTNIYESYAMSRIRAREIRKKCGYAGPLKDKKKYELSS